MNVFIITTTFVFVTARERSAGVSRSCEIYREKRLRQRFFGGRTAVDQSEDSCQPRKKQKLCDSTPSTLISTPSVGQMQQEPATSEDIPEGANRISCESTQCSHCETGMHIDVKNVARPSYDPSKMTIDHNCAECRERYRDPAVEELTMYLHALRYEVSYARLMIQKCFNR